VLVMRTGRVSLLLSLCCVWERVCIGWGAEKGRHGITHTYAQTYTCMLYGHAHACMGCMQPPTGSQQYTHTHTEKREREGGREGGREREREKPQGPLTRVRARNLSVCTCVFACVSAFVYVCVCVYVLIPIPRCDQHRIQFAQDAAHANHHQARQTRTLGSRCHCRPVRSSPRKVSLPPCPSPSLTPFPAPSSPHADDPSLHLDASALQRQGF
jgi:hypothetical protein